MKNKYLILQIAISFSILLSQTLVSTNNQIKLTTISYPENEILEAIESTTGGRMGDFHTPELVGTINSSISYTPMDIAWDGTYYYASNGGTSIMPVHRFDEQFNYIDQQNINVDSRGLVQHPIDGNLYMKSYNTGSFYRVNTDPFDGSVEYLYDLSGNGGQTMFTFSANGQYVLVYNNNGLVRKHDFTTGDFVASFNLQEYWSGQGIANTGSYLLINGGSSILFAHDEQGNFVGQINFPQNIYSGYGTPSYANGLCFTSTGSSTWSVWDIDDGIMTVPGCTDPYADNYDPSANEDDGSCSGYPNNGSYSLSFDGVDDYTSLDWSDQLSTYTVSMWVISNAEQQTNFDAFFSTHHPNSSGFQLDTDNGNRLRMLTPDFSMTFNEVIPTYWSHVAVVAETNGAVEKTTIYFNGDSVTSVNDVESSWNKIDLGRNRNENSPGNWTLDEVSVWNTARTAEQIQSDMYNAHLGSEEGLLVYWKANAGTGTVLYDHTGNANHATINGATWSSDTPILYQPQSKEELQTAVNLWVNDEASALMTYGDISVWDVSLITDMSFLFQDKNSFNSNISAWDVSNVVNMEGMFDKCYAFNGDLSSWDVSNVTSMSWMFHRADVFNSDLSGWDVSSLQTMDAIFHRAGQFTSDLSNWNVSNVLNAGGAFYAASSFDSDLSGWDVSGVTNMGATFREANSFNGDLSSWDVSNVTAMGAMFYNNTSFNSDLSAWDVSNVTDFSSMFDGTSLSEENKCAIHSSWQDNVNWSYGDWASFCQLCPPSNLTGFPTYNSVSLSWDAPGGCENYVVNELPYFHAGSNASATDDWPVSGSDDKDIAYKITLTETTTLDISTCNEYTDFDTKLSIFNGCNGQEIFYIDDNYSNGTCTFHPFYAYLSGITLNPGTYYIVVDGYGGQVGNYGISIEESPSNVNNNNFYTFEMQSGQEVRKMQNDGFSIQEIESLMNGNELNAEGSRNGRDIENFCGTFNQYGVYSASSADGPWELIAETTDTTYTHLGLENETEYFYKVTTEYEEGQSEPSMTISVNTLGLFEIVNGEFENFTVSDNGWQRLADGWQSYSTSSDILYNVELHGSAIYNSATEIFDGLNQTNGLKMWNNCTEGNCDNYPTNAEHFVFQERSNIMRPGTQFSISAMVWQHPEDALQDDAKFELVVKYFGLGEGGSVENPGEWWNNLIGMERSLPFTNQDTFETWTIRSLDCYVPYGTFRVEYGLLLTNSETGGGGSIYVDNVELTLVSLPFKPQTKEELQVAVDLWENDNASALDSYGEINLWDVTLISDMSFLFEGKANFNSDISAWDVSNVTNMAYMFKDAFNFNQPLGSWDVSNVTSMDHTLQGARVFNQDISTWDVSNVTTMNELFKDCFVFNGDISNWDVSNVTDLTKTFFNSYVFNSDLSNWDVSNVTSMQYLFSNSSFNGDISSWNVSNVTNMSFLFANASEFNQDISNWNTSNLTSMQNMFINASSFNSDISSWDVSNVTSMSNAFKNASSFNQNVSNWDIYFVTEMEGIFDGETGLNDSNKCYIDDLFQSNTVWPYDWAGFCQPHLSEISNISILEDDTYNIDLDSISVFLNSNQDIYSFSSYSDTSAVVVETEGSNVNIIPSPDWNGVTLVTVVVENDLSDLYDETSFMLTVEPVDDVPFVDLYLTDFNLEEDFVDTIQTDLNEVFKDIDGDLTFAFMLSDENIISVNIEDEMLEFTSFQDVFGQTELIVTASNPTRASVSDTVLLSVLPVNDSPVVSIVNDTIIFDEDQFISLASIVEMRDNGLWFDVDNSIENLNFELFSESEFIHIEWDGDNQSNAILSADQNFYGEGAITFCVDDGEYNVCGNRVIMVNPVNDAPYFHGEMHGLAGFGREFYFPIHVGDVDSEDLIISFADSSNIPSWVHLSENALYGIADFLGQYALPLKVHDGETYSEETFHLQVENFSPVLLSVDDVPNDQGGRVYIHFDRSYLDHPEETGQFYTVFRQDTINDTLQWVSVSTVSAAGQGTYIAEVQTQADSTSNFNGLTQFKLVAFLHMGTFESEIMSGYSLDNLGPPAPTGLVCQQIGLNMELHWEQMNLEDLDYFIVYRSDESDFIPSENHLLWQGTTASFMDTTASWTTPYFYIVQATDISGNQGEISNAIEGYINMEVTLASPEDSAFIAITGEDLSSQGQVTFSWELNDDALGEDLEHHFTLTHEDSEVLIDTFLISNEIEISHEAVIDLITVMGGNSLQGSWTVHVTDGQNTVLSNEIRIISFDASDVLSLDGSIIPLDFTLSQNYPNPFNPSTKIKYSIPSTEFVSIVIYDLMGRSIKSFVNIEQNAGYYELHWNATNNEGYPVPAGMYFYIIKAGTFKSTKKMLLLK